MQHIGIRGIITLRLYLKENKSEHRRALQSIHSYIIGVPKEKILRPMLLLTYLNYLLSLDINLMIMTQ